MFQAPLQTTVITQHFSQQPVFRVLFNRCVCVCVLSDWSLCDMLHDFINDNTVWVCVCLWWAYSFCMYLSQCHCMTVIWRTFGVSCHGMELTSGCSVNSRKNPSLISVHHGSDIDTQNIFHLHAYTLFRFIFLLTCMSRMWEETSVNTGRACFWERKWRISSCEMRVQTVALAPFFYWIFHPNASLTSLICTHSNVVLCKLHFASGVHWEQYILLI